MKNIIEFFTKNNEVILECFMGVGGTLLGAAMCSRRAIGIGLNKEYIDAYIKSAKFMEVDVKPTIIGDSLKILNDKDKMLSILGEEKVGLVLIDPPCGDIDVYGAVATPFTDS